MSDRVGADLRFRDLGPLAVERDGQLLPAQGRRITATLGVLLVRANQRTSMDALIDAVFDEQAARSAKTMDSHLWRLRQLLEPDRRRGEPFTTIVHDTAGYRLIATEEQVDSLLFERWAGEVRDLLVSDQPGRALTRCDQALGLWRGEPWTPHTDAEWATTPASRLREIRDQVREQRIQALLKLGDPETALADVDPMLVDNPLRERLWAMAMLAAYRAGRIDQALDIYARARRTLIEEAGIEPGSDLRDLHAKILDRDTSLDGPNRNPGPGLGSSRDSDRLPPQAPVAPVEVRLPNRRTELLGRAAELEQLIAAVSTKALVTVVGPAGCGKTRLVIEVARQAAGTFPDGVWFVDLTAANDQGQLLDLITSTLGLAAPEVGTVTEALRAFTRTRRMLLVLDNCEHVLDPVADLVDTLLDQDSELTLLATSREPLDLDLEHRWRLGPLPLPPAGSVEDHLKASPAVQLFLQRLAVATSGVAVGPHELELAVRICTAVDSLPLAIELAAGQARSFSLDEIAARVRVDPAGLSRVGRGSRHHATLRGAIELSAGMLNPVELAVHQAVAVVPGPFTAGLAASLVDISYDQAAAALANLAHRSLLTPLGSRRLDGPSRFSQLATIRAHGLGVPGVGGRPAAGPRRDRWVAELVMDKPHTGHVTEPAWWARIDNDLAAVRATLQHCLVEDPDPIGIAVAARLGNYWYYRGMVVEWERWTGLASRSAVGEPFDQLLAGCTYACAAGLAGRGEYYRAWLDDLDTFSAPLSPDQKVMLGEYLLSVSLTTWIMGTSDASQRAAAHADLLAEETKNPAVGLLADVAQLIVATQTRPSAEVLLAAEGCYRRARAAQNHFASWVTATAGVVASIAERDTAQGLKWSDISLQHFQNLGSEANATAVELRGTLLAMDGQPYEAVRTLARSRTMARRFGMRWPVLASTRNVLATAEMRLSTAERERAYREGTLTSVTTEHPQPSLGSDRQAVPEVAAS